MSVQKIYARRMSLVFVFFMCFFAIAFGYLYVLQIRSHAFFAQLAQRQYYGTITKMPARAPIFDCKGRYLALNRQSLSIFLVPAQLKKPHEVKKFLLAHFPQAYERLNTKPDAQFMYIKRHISVPEERLVQNAQLDDIKVLQEPYRFYTVPSLGYVIGRTNSDNSGVFGLEAFFNERLAGKPAVCVLEKDARSGHFYFEKETTCSGSEGQSITTTFDRDIQSVVGSILQDYCGEKEAFEGAVIIMDPETGGLKALSYFPSFDPNKTHFDGSVQTKCKPITDVYEPGSVIKVFLALAALAEGVVTPDEIIDCQMTREARVGGRRVTTWRAHGSLSFTDVIKKSNNIGTSKIALRIGQKLYDHYCRCGFGSKTHISCGGEQSGFVNPPNAWSKDSLLSLSYGYEISTTLLQLARAFSLFSNGGYLVNPHLIVSDDNQARVILYDQKILDQVRDIITMYWPEMKHVHIMGKTGTANVLKNGAYDPSVNVYTFCCIVEAGDYKRVVVTYVKNTSKIRTYASQIALPLARRIIRRMLVCDGIVPQLKG